MARISGKDRSTGDAKAHLDNQLARTEASRDAIKKSLKRKEGFSVEAAGYAKPIVIEERDIRASDEEDTYRLHLPRIVINPDSKIALTGQNGTGKGRPHKRSYVPASRNPGFPRGADSCRV